MTHRIGLIVLGLSLFWPGTTFGSAKAKAAREAAEYLMRKFGKEAAEEGVEKLTLRLEKAAAKYGDEVFDATRKVGPRALRLLDDAAEHAPEAARLLSRYGDEAVYLASRKTGLALVKRFGDDAAESIIKHGEIAEPLLTNFGAPAARALKTVGSRNARRIAMMAKDGDFAKIGRTEELLNVVEKYGDKAADFIWRHKGSLAVAAVLTGFLADPKPFIEGTKDLVEIVGETAVQPLAEAPKELATEAAKRTNWTVVGLAAIVVTGLLLGARMWLKQSQDSIR
jgi:hypothetical protein